MGLHGFPWSDWRAFTGEEWKDRDGNLEGGWIGFYKFYLFFSQVLGYADNKDEPNN
jgi:hypothetical protein